MTSETERIVYQTFTASQERHAYFLIAAAGAAIAFGVARTESSVWTSAMPLWCLAIGSWAGSFFCGIQFMQHIGTGLYANMGLLKVQAGKDDLAGENPALIAFATDVIRKSVDQVSIKASRYGTAQFVLLITGAAFYIAWHVAEMVARPVLATAIGTGSP